MVEVSCQECGKPFTVFPGKVATAKFCGNPCKFAYQKRNPPRPRIPRVTQPCGWCGELVEFLASQRTARRLKGVSDTVYCDRACKGKAHRLLMTGRRPSNGSYTSPATFRTIVRREFYDRCAICGWAEAPCDVAHIIARKDGGTDTADNVVMLCPNHHRMFDYGLLPVELVRLSRPNCTRLVGLSIQ